MSSYFVRLVHFNSLYQRTGFNGTRMIHSGAALCKFYKERPSNESLISWKKLPAPKKSEKDYWSEKRALFGENDYKDILGDGTYSLRKNVKVGPWWMRGWKGNELQMMIRKRKMVGYQMGPETRHNMNKRISYLFKFMNRNKGKWAYYGDR
ncbi:39S ribosomal protein L51, mitochondrial [Strongylocentrotus purpuratus]|uniref:Large ribosomal subunit protein mL51 n=1 Tax=Strongylocentrotus purpuratus TaxID=7668 RepID=A0A7M7REX9_STRPU|nr:39S ribosomal protein L51, mitochondrial [Strongylocentrotus purpuratus]